MALAINDFYGDICSALVCFRLCERQYQSGVVIIQQQSEAVHQRF